MAALLQKGAGAAEQSPACPEGRDLTIRLGDFPGKEIALRKPLKGWRKNFYAGNWQGRRVLRIFGFKLASWNK